MTTRRKFFALLLAAWPLAQIVNAKKSKAAINDLSKARLNRLLNGIWNDVKKPEWISTGSTFPAFMDGNPTTMGIVFRMIDGGTEIAFQDLPSGKIGKCVEIKEAGVPMLEWRPLKEDDDDK